MEGHLLGRALPRNGRLLNLIGCIGVGILAVVAYCVDLGRNGLGNPFYAAAVQAGAHSAHNAFFAAIDLGGTMSVDKPPLSLWLMELSVRVLGLNPTGELLPDALAGVATTAVVVLLVREWTSLRWGLFAGLLSLASPMANVMFRFNNPDGLLTLLTVATVWCFTSALRRPSPWKLVGAGVLIAAAILTKLLAGVVIVPVLVIAYALWSPTTPWARLRHLVLLGATAGICSLWYFVTLNATDAASRPWIDGTADNNPFSLLISSDVNRLVGEHHRAAISAPGLFRMFDHLELANYGPFIVLALLTWGAAAATRSGRRPDLRVASLVTGSGIWVCLVMSFIQGGYHTYYAVISTPVLAAGAALNLALIWHHPSRDVRARILALVLLANAGFDVWVWSRYSADALLGIVTAVLVAVGVVTLTMIRRPRVGLVALVVSALLLPSTYTWMTWRAPHTGGSPYGGPISNDAAWDAYPPMTNNFSFPSRISPALRELFEAARGYRYVVAMQRDEEAGSVQLATGVSVLPLTGWQSTPVGMLQRFEDLVNDREVRYFLPTGAASAIKWWVTAHFATFDVGDQPVYDLTRVVHESPWIRPMHIQRL